MLEMYVEWSAVGDTHKGWSDRCSNMCRKFYFEHGSASSGNVKSAARQAGHQCRYLGRGHVGCAAAYQLFSI
jgi:hypothetical protein